MAESLAAPPAPKAEAADEQAQRAAIVGELAVLDGISTPGNYVDLRAEMDVLCVISNCPQLNNPCNGYDPTPIQVLIWSGV